MSVAAKSESDGKRVRKPKLHYSPEDYVCEQFENDPSWFNGKVPPHGGWKAHSSHTYTEQPKDDGKRVRKPKLHYSPEDYVCEQYESDPALFNGKVPPHGGWKAHSSHAKEYRPLQQVYEQNKQLAVKNDGRRKRKSGSNSSGQKGFIVSNSDSGDDGNCSTLVKRRRGRPIGSGIKRGIVQNMAKDASVAVKRGRGRPRRTNKAIDDRRQNMNKWETYKKDALKYIRMISQANYVVNVYQQDKGHQDMGFARDEIDRYIRKIHSSKMLLKDLIKQIADENMNHTQYDQLKEGADDDGMIDINDIYCSACHLDAESEENDIVLCDRAGCNRAYHLLCLDPPIQSLSKAGFEEDDDWFCWRCEVLDCVLDNINDVLDTNYNEHNLFPELDRELINSNDFDEEQEEDEDDNDYNPEEASDGEYESEMDQDDDGEGSDTENGSDRSVISSDELNDLVADCGNDSYLGDGNNDSSYYTRNKGPNNRIVDRSKLITIEDFDETNMLPDGARRNRNKVDYIKLSEEMFGDAEDSDADSDRRRKTKLNKRKKNNYQGFANHVNVENKVIKSDGQIVVKRKRGRPRKSDSLTYLERSTSMSSTICEGDHNKFKHRLLSRFSISSSESVSSSPERILQAVKSFMEKMDVVHIHDYCNSEGIEYEEFMTSIAGISLGYYDQYMSKEQISFFRGIAVENMRRFDQLLGNAS